MIFLKKKKKGSIVLIQESPCRSYCHQNHTLFSTEYRHLFIFPHSFCLGEFCFVLAAAEVILSVCSMMLINQMLQPGTQEHLGWLQLLGISVEIAGTGEGKDSRWERQCVGKDFYLHPFL